MDLAKLKKDNMIIYDCITGSTVYNLNTPASDVDRAGIFVYPKEQYLSLITPIQEVSDGKDVKFMDLRKFLSLAKDCNPNIVELFFTPPEFVRFCDPRMKILLNNRNLFITQKAYHTFSGYAHAQIKKATGQHKLINNPMPAQPPCKEDFCWVVTASSLFSKITRLDPKDTEMPARPVPLKTLIANGRFETLDKYHCAALEHVSNTFRLYYYGDKAKGVFRGNGILVCESIPKEDERTAFAGLLIYDEQAYEKRLKAHKQYWEWVAVRNNNRWVAQENKSADYDAKNMMHCFRLLLSGKNILRHGEPLVRFEGRNREWLMNIRNNKYSYALLMVILEQEMAELEELKNTTKLPYSADVNKIDQLYRHMLET